MQHTSRRPTTNSWILEKGNTIDAAVTGGHGDPLTVADRLAGPHFYG